MDNEKNIFKELLLKTISTKAFWRLSIACLLLLIILISVVIELRVDKATVDTADKTEQSESIVNVDEDITYVTHEDAGHDSNVEDVIVEDTDVTVATRVETAVDIVGNKAIAIKTEAEEDTDNEIIYDIHNTEMTDLDMLALVIYQEAGGDATCDECRYRVADVVLNRVASDRFPNTIYEVLTQYAQYGRLSWTGLVWPERAYYEVEAHAVERAYRVAQDVLNGNHSELYGNGYIWQAEFIQGSDNIYCCGHYFGR